MLKHTFKPAQAANDFVVTVADADWSQKWIDLISNQVTGIDINLVWKRVTLYVRQLKSGIIQDLIFHILDRDYRKIDDVRITPVRGQTYEMVFSNGELVDHEANFSYFDRGDLVHVLVFQFENVTLFSNGKEAIRPSVMLGNDGDPI